MTLESVVQLHSSSLVSGSLQKKSAVGLSVGLSDGAPVGAFEGDFVGETVGSPDGDNVGLHVGSIHVTRSI